VLGSGVSPGALTLTPWPSQADARHRTKDEYNIHDAAEEGEFAVVRDHLISDLSSVDYYCRRRCDCSSFPVIYFVFYFSLSFSCSIRECTALHLAARGGHIDVCQLLIGAHADVNALLSRRCHFQHPPHSCNRF
jgi:hypothetical protein